MAKMNLRRIGVAVALMPLTLLGMNAESGSQDAVAAKTGSVIFIHPDGTGAGHWNILRALKVGPDADLNWDRMERLALYRVGQKNNLSTSSHAGASTHATGKRVHINSFGLDRTDPITALSGSSKTIMEEAIAAGMPVGIVNSGHLAEPGTAVFLARSEDRNNSDLITAQLIESDARVIFGGGERMLLPEGTAGVHCASGMRRDGRNLIEEARARGFTVIFTRDELLALPTDTPRVLGVFADYHTFNDRSEEELREAGLPNFNPDAPTLAEMTEVALRLLDRDAKPFFLVVEEEGTDNFSNNMNAGGMIDALWRADDAIGLVMDYIKQHPRTLLITAADSDAGAPVIQPHDMRRGPTLPLRSASGAALDGVEGSKSAPFMAKADAQGEERAFGVAWASSDDLPGAVIVRTHGLNAGILPPEIFNTDVYRIMYYTLFGRLPAAQLETDATRISVP